MTNLQWAPFGHSGSQMAPSALTTRGQALRWHLNSAGDDRWTAVLAPEGKQSVKIMHLAGTETDAKEEVQEVENEHLQENGGSVLFPFYELVAHYHLVGGGDVAEVVESRPEIPFRIGEMNTYVAQQVTKKLKKARRAGKLMKVYTINGSIARVDPRRVTHFDIVQRDERRLEIPAEPGWPDHMTAAAEEDEAAAQGMLTHLIALIMSYGDRRVEAHASERPAEPAANKAAFAALADIREHLAGHLGVDEMS